MSSPPRFMVDSTNINDDPADAAVVLYYCDGIYAVSEAVVRARFPNAVLVPCSAIGTNSGIVGDVEPGCMTIAQSTLWVVNRRRAGEDPTLYCNELHTWPLLKAAFQAAGVPEPHYIVADYDGIAVIPAGAEGKQFKNPLLTGGHYDLSVIADFLPGIDKTYGPATGDLGGLDMAQADDILAAVRRPKPLPDKPARFMNQTDQQLIATIVAQSTWEGISRVYTPAEEAYLYAISHPSFITVFDAIDALSGIVKDESVEIAAVKAEEDQIKAALIQAPSAPVGQDAIGRTA